jgi:hypothetical protein
VNTLIALSIGIIVGATANYLFLNRIYRRKLAKLERVIERYQVESTDIRDVPVDSVLNLKVEPITQGNRSVSGSIIKTSVVEVDSTELQEFLKTRGIQIKRIPPRQECDDILDRLAMFMGNRYNSIEKLYARIKSSMDRGYSFTIDLKNLPQEQIANICQLATRLHDLAFLEEYRYQKSPHFILSAKPSRNPKALSFFSGQWLERFVKDRTIEAIRKTHLELQYSYLLNPQITLPNGDDFELDAIFKIGDDIFWFEAKTGNYQRYLEKYAKISSILGLDREHAFMILTDISETSAQELSSLFKMKVVNIESFVEHLDRAFEKLRPVL